MRPFSIFLFYLIVLGGFSQSFNNGLILNYPFNGNALDTSENQFHGITNASFTDDRFGNPNSAIHFNGIDQYLDFPPNKPMLKPLLPVSFAFWIKFEDTIPIVTTIFTTDFDQNNHTGVWVSCTTLGVLGCGYGDGTQYCSVYNRRSKYGSTIINSNTWYFVIVIVRDSTDMSIYLDCVEEGGYYDGYGGPLAYTDCQGSLGRKDATSTYPPDYLFGAMDDFRYWNRALSNDEIDSLCNILKTNKIPAKKEDAILLFPNPATNYLNMNNLPNNVAQIELVDSYGKVIRSYAVTEKISISALSMGIYFLRFIDNQKNIIDSKKIIKE